MTISRNTENQLQPVLSDLLFRCTLIQKSQSGIPALLPLSSFFTNLIQIYTCFALLNCFLCFDDTRPTQRSPASRVLFLALSPESHTIHVEQPAATRDSIFLPPFSSFGRKCRLEVSELLQTTLLPSTALLTGPGDSQKRRISLTELVCELCQEWEGDFFVVALLKISSFAE